MGRRYRKKTGGKPSKKRVVKKSGRPTKAFTKLVKSVINRQAETKQAQAYWSGGLVSRASANFTERTLYYLGPGREGGYPAGQQLEFGLGTQDGQRIGNVIKTHKCMLRLNIFPTGYNETTNIAPKPYLVTLWIFRLVGDQWGLRSTAANMITNTMFDNGPLSGGIQNNLTDHIRPYNDSSVRVMRKITFKVGNQDMVGTGSNLGKQYYSNNDYKLNIIKYINVTKYIAKTYTFEDTNLSPTTKKTYFCFTFAPADGSAGALPDPFSPIQVNWHMDYQYKDI